MNAASLYNEHNAHYLYATDVMGLDPLDAREYATYMMPSFEPGDWVGQHDDLAAIGDEDAMLHLLGYDVDDEALLPDVPDYLLTEFYDDLDTFTSHEAWYGDDS